MAALGKLQEKRVDVSVDKWWLTSNSINVFVSGKTGTGKSTLVNALLGKEVATVGVSLDPETSKVQCFKGNIQGVEVTVWDSPGLQDGTKNEDKYLKDIKEKCNGKIDLLLYCISMNTTRFEEGGPDMESMIKLTKTLGPEIWKNAVVILTCANIEIRSMNRLDPENVEEKFDGRLDEWKSEIVQSLVKLSVEDAQKVEILPAGRIELPLLFKDHRPWLSRLWIESLAATRLKAQPALIKMNINRLINSSDVMKEDDIRDIQREQKIIIHDKAIEVGKKKWFVKPERADIVGQVVSRRNLSYRGEIVEGTLRNILPDIQRSRVYEKFPEIVVSLLSVYLNKDEPEAEAQSI